VKCYDHLNFLKVSIVQFRASRYVMCWNRTYEWKVMTIWISWGLSLLNFECLDILFLRIGHPCEKLWPFEFLESFCCSILSVSICYASESDIRVKCYEHLNFSRASVVQFWTSWYVMRLNQTSEWKFMTILNFSRASVVQFRASRYIMQLNRTSEWKVITLWISLELPLFNFERLYILYHRIGHLS